MDNLLLIYKKSEYLKILLGDFENIKDIENEIIVLFKQAYEQLNLDFNLKITYEQYIEYLINLTTNYKKIKYTKNNILQYMILSDYFQLDNQHNFFNYIVDIYIFKQNIFYNKLYSYNPINYYILHKFGKEYSYINNNTFLYIFKINKNICDEITTLYSQHIEQNLLNMCNNIINLYICYNEKITDVNHLQQLEKLDISGQCGVDQNGILQLKFIKFLNIGYNDKIINVNHLQLLEELHACSATGIIQNGISQLIHIKKLNIQNNYTITNLNIQNNVHITDVNHLQQLEVLNISGEFCGVTQEGISNLKLVKNLYAYGNTKITDVNFYKK